jgi:hypothetical protein
MKTKASEEVNMSKTSTHTHLGTGQQVTVKVDAGTVRRETEEERRIRRSLELPVLMAAKK